VRFDTAAQEATRADYVAEVEHARERITRLEQALDEAVTAAPPAMRAIIDALQALRGIAKVAAVTIVAEVGRLARFDRPRQLMGYSGAVPGEHSSGARVRRGAITKTGNAHLRRIVVEAAWSYRHGPRMGPTLRHRQAGQSDEVKAIAWKAQHRLYSRYRRLTARGKAKQQVVTAVARELLGFIWAIGVAVERAQPDHRAA
jgi:transposase